MSDVVTTLRKIPNFRDLGKKDLDVLAGNMDEIDFPAGKVLIEQGKPNHTFYVLLDGITAVSVGGQFRRILKSGDFFGEISMHERTLATATVAATTAIRALVMSHEQFKAIAAAPEVRARIMAAIAEWRRMDDLLGP